MQEWWQRFKLISNPLTERIPFTTEREFENLLVETKIFRVFNNLLIKPDRLLNKVILITGEFGSGKTVLFDYIRFNLIKHSDIIQKIIFLGNPYKNSVILRDDFYNKLYYELTRKHNPVASELSILELLQSLKEKRKIKGLVLILDELHKNPEYEITLDFLKYLQSFFQEVQRIMKFTIIAVGRVEWEERLRNNPQYSGTISQYYRMPELEVNEALDIIHKRLIFYSEDETCAKKNEERITKEAMEKIFQNIFSRTPREVMMETNRIFENLKTGVEIVTPYQITHQIDNTTLSLIKRTIKSRQFIQLNKDLLTVKDELSNEEFEIAIQVLSELKHRSTLTVKEWDNLYTILNVDNDIIRQIKILLLTKKLISSKEKILREKRKHGAIQITQTYYELRKDISNFFGNIEEKYDAHPEDYLSLIYKDDAIPIETIKTGTKEHQLDNISLYLQQIQESLKSYKKISRSLDHIKKAINSHSRIMKYLQSVKSGIKPNEIFLHMKSSVIELLKTIEIYRQSSGDIKLDENKLLKEALKEYGEEYGEWYPKTESIKSEGIEITKDVIDHLLEYYMDSMHEISLNFNRDLKQDVILTIYPYNLERKERTEFYVIRDKLFNNEWNEALSKLRRLYEIFLRKFIKEELEFHKGDEWLSLIPESILNQSKKIKSKEIANAKVDEMDDILNYTYLLDLKDIIKVNWDKFSGFFTNQRKSDKEKELQIFENELLRLNKLRRIETHSRDFSPENRNQVIKVTHETIERISDITFERRKRHRGLNFIFDMDEIHVDYEKVKNYVFIQIGSLNGYISEAIWKDFQQNKQVKEILLNSKPVSFDDLENITLPSTQNWKDILLCFALAIYKGKYRCEVKEKRFIFSKA